MSVHLFIKVTSFVIGILGVLTIVALLVLFYWSQYVITEEETAQAVYVEESYSVISREDKFPVGVDESTQTITENPGVDAFVETYLDIDTLASRDDRLLDRLLATLVKWDWYQSLASSVSRILVIYPGERHEEVVDNFGDILKWTKEERDLFYNYIAIAEPELDEGKFLPGRYVVPYDASPEQVADLLYDKLKSEILDRYDSEVAKQVSFEDAIIIASMIEREAYDFVDMRYISGIIWNRLFINMPLQLDATLQYVRGSSASESKWWPKVVPKDKFIESPYNTYENKGLPPGAISNPSPEAIVAALNPRKTDCMFYFHDRKGKFYCTENYKDHVTKLKEVYGQGS